MPRSGPAAAHAAPAATRVRPRIESMPPLGMISGRVGSQASGLSAYGWQAPAWDRPVMSRPPPAPEAPAAMSLLRPLTRASQDEEGRPAGRAALPVQIGRAACRERAAQE